MLTLITKITQGALVLSADHSRQVRHCRLLDEDRASSGCLWEGARSGSPDPGVLAPNPSALASLLSPPYRRRAYHLAPAPSVNPPSLC